MLPANRPDHEVGWPRAVQTGVAILGACAFGAVALSYGYGFGGGGRAETYPQVAAAATPPDTFWTQTGPNYDPAWGLSEWFVLDPTQSDQSGRNGGAINGVNTFNEQGQWGSIVADSGTAFNRSYGDTVAVDFVWASGNDTWHSANEMNVDTMCSSYTRMTVRYDSDWEWSGGTFKAIWYQNSTGQMNAAPGLYSSGKPALVNVMVGWPADSTITAGQWADIEIYYKYMGTDSSEVKVWLDNVLVRDSVGFSYANTYPATKINFQPFHGGAGVKTQVDTFRYARAITYADAGPCT